MPDITITKEPNDINLAYGKNIVTLTDVDVPPITTRYLLRVIDGDDNQVAELRQLPNTSGYAHFDLQNILKNQVTHNPALESISKLAVSDNEVFAYTIDYGYIDGTGTAQTSSFTGSGEFAVFNGRKPHNEIDWDYSDYAPEVGTNIITTPGGPIEQLYFDTTTYQQALTDRHIESTVYANITDGKPSWASLTGTPVIYKILKGSDDHYTLSWLNDYVLTDNPTYNTLSAFTNGISGFYVAAFSNSTELTPANTVIENTTGNGGGPNVAAGDAIQPTNQYKAITLQVSELNPTLATYTTATHYYVAPFYWSRDPDTSTTKTVVGHVYRFDIDNGQCNDFDHIQVSWVNSFGFRDYFNFQKRNDYNVTTKQDTYQQLDADWSGQTISVNSYNRGERVFNKSMQEAYVANTRYLSDEESQYLKNLYISPDIKVRFAGSDEWVPVILTDTQYTERTFRKDKMFQHTINFRLANPQQIQRG